MTGVRMRWSRRRWIRLRPSSFGSIRSTTAASYGTVAASSRAGLAVRGVIDGEPAFLEPLDEKVGDSEVVFDDQHPHRVTLTRFSITEARFEKGNQQRGGDLEPMSQTDTAAIA